MGLKQERMRSISVVDGVGDGGKSHSKDLVVQYREQI